jgi:hypothetical protein
MSTLDVSTWSLAERASNVVATAAADDRSLASPGAAREANRRDWQHLIDSRLIEWGRDPALLDDEGVAPPSSQAISSACQIAMMLRDYCSPPPCRVVASGDSGVVFERWSGDCFEALEVYDDGAAELSTFVNSRLTSHRRIA